MEKDFCFRFFSLKKSQLENLNNFFSNYSYEVTKLKNGNFYTVFFELKERILIKDITTFIDEEKLPYENFGIWVSIYTNRKNLSVSLPEIYLELINVLDCKIDFSFTREI